MAASMPSALSRDPLSQGKFRAGVVVVVVVVVERNCMVCFRAGKFQASAMDEARCANWCEQVGPSGAKDLAIIARMGAKMVRLYGNEPRFDGKKFLDYANRWGLKVVAGISDYPYEHGPGKCWKNVARLQEQSGLLKSTDYR